MNKVSENLCNSRYLLLGMKPFRKKIIQSNRSLAISLLITLPVLFLSGCGLIISKASKGMADNLTLAILNQDDPKTVEAGLPAYLILIDSMIQSNPKNSDILLAGAKLYSSYATVFVKEDVRAGRLGDRARKYSQDALCKKNKQWCQLDQLGFEEFAKSIKMIKKSDISMFYAYGVAWAGWIQTHKEEMIAIAEIPKVKAIIKQVLLLDDRHDDGGAHLYMGYITSLLPPAVGGKPEEVKYHFDRAISISEGNNLMAKVLKAERYARMVFDRKLHDTILNGVLQDDPHKPGLTLMNVLAQQQAKDLLSTANRYF
jgi:uncharacterized protein YceK